MSDIDSTMDPNATDIVRARMPLAEDPSLSERTAEVREILSQAQDALNQVCVLLGCASTQARDLDRRFHEALATALAHLVEMEDCLYVADGLTHKMRKERAALGLV